MCASILIESDQSPVPGRELLVVIAAGGHRFPRRRGDRSTISLDVSGQYRNKPADAVKRPQLPKATPKGLTSSRTWAIGRNAPVTVLGTEKRAITLLAVLTGLRRDELIGLTAGDLTLDDDGVILVDDYGRAADGLGYRRLTADRAREPIARAQAVRGGRMTT